jgi:hypothetical protein
MPGGDGEGGCCYENYVAVSLSVGLNEVKQTMHTHIAVGGRW